MASSDFIQRAYIAFFNRPADRAGFDYWRGYSGNDHDLLNEFGQSSEYLSDFSGKNHRETIGTIYQNLFGRQPDKTGWDYWATQMEAGWVTVGNAAHAILGATQGMDATTIKNKVAVAQKFTNALDTAPEIDAYAKAGDNGAGHIAKDWLAAVKDSNSSYNTALSKLDSVLSVLMDTNLHNQPGQQPVLTQDALQSLFSAARQYWLDVGVKEASLNGIKFSVGSLSEYGENVLAIASGKEITFSYTAVGGLTNWFVDPTPYSHEESSGGGTFGFKALPGSAAAGNMDVLTVFMHEIGHVLGLGHNVISWNLMYATLDAGVRLLPSSSNYNDIRYNDMRNNFFKLTGADPITMDTLLESWGCEGDDAHAWHGDTLAFGEIWDSIRVIGYVDIGQGMDSQIVCHIDS